MTPVELLTNWVKLKHTGQLIKRSGEPYFNHLLAVAEMAKSATPMGYEIGLCHDLLEDTGTDAEELLENLVHFGYEDMTASYITSRVVELTDVYTASTYPDLSKIERKEKEATRRATVSPGAQTIEYADLIYNIGWMLQYDQKHAEKYLKRKRALIGQMVTGDSGLRQRVLAVIDKALIT
ncbi:hypothetical protein SAMN05421821_101367 [Mucilaginibacter lappiensis]|uniref:(P)ppGpp synthase/HD superfamily hydrolase n=1 Tax=Mucilaginibacter lappiensis TaxID=354630 RepID=A0ABR6PD70_9SPHI|nr:hypothetical protein [Mucilaginibacter lappiensis]MBB6107717.1 (p)ppGpp synthase/HD superfamily hydrolase [Mucilaginibacter lappiensis]SIP99367.1 hypothetical protein SAMN05421821_101367 [Mucilaginibacter lappiensis]